MHSRPLPEARVAGRSRRLFESHAARRPHALLGGRATGAAALLLLAAGCSRGPGVPDGSGTIESTQVRVSPQVSGRIVSIEADEGDSVAAGGVVARLDETDYGLRRSQAAGALEYAEAQLALLIAGPRAEDVELARQRVREAEASAKAAEADRRRIDVLHAAGSASEKQRDDAVAQADRAAAALAAAEQVLAKLIAGSREEELRAARALVGKAEAELALAEKAVSDCTVRSPIGGTVTTRSREVGELVSIGSVIATVSDLRETWLTVYVPAARLPRIRIGQSARVAVDSEGTLREGVVTFVSPEAEFTPRDVQTPGEREKLVHRVKIALPNPDGALKPGMAADAFLGGTS